MSRIVWLLALLLTGCSVQNGQFSVPTQIQFSGKLFEIAADNQLDDLRQLLYLPQKSAKNSNHWQQGFLIFLDRNSQGITLAQRLTLRQNHFAQQPNTVANIQRVHDELQSQVLYPPTERLPNYQLEVTRGREFGCGFGQMQFADKRSDFAKNMQQPTAYRQQLEVLAQQLSQLPWLMECRK